MLHFPTWKIAAISLTCLLAVLLAIPSFLTDSQRAHMPSFMPNKAVSLGLDLRGGSHLLLQLDFDAYQKDQLATLVDDIRSKLRTEKVGYIGLAAKDHGVTFSVREDADKDITKILHQIDPDLDVSADGKNYTITFGDKWVTARKQQIIAQSLEIIHRRIDETGTREPIIQRQGIDRILVQVPGVENPEHIKELLGRTAKMTFHLLNHDVTQEDIKSGNIPSTTHLVKADEREGARVYPVYNRVELGGDSLTDANAAFENGEAVVSFRFNTKGAQKFGEITSQNVGKPFAIVLDDKVITAPVIRSPILGGSGIISGNFDTKSANDLALLLRAGALPAPLKVIEERSVGPSLGSDSIKAGTTAALIGVIYVVVFMFVCYGLFGLIADIAMIINAMIVLALLAMLGATLTLPGIAGIVLTMGMAVDTNVLIYERMREEVRNGKSPYAAVESGFRMAFGTIIDSHLTTLSAALLLFYFGTGTVKGFGVTLSIGIVASLFTAVLVTRLMIVLWLKKAKPKVLPL